jgi:hypothetical protein
VLQITIETCHAYWTDNHAVVTYNFHLYFCLLLDYVHYLIFYVIFIPLVLVFTLLFVVCVLHFQLCRYVTFTTLPAFTYVKLWSEAS